MSELFNFVEERFGHEFVKKLKNIRTGGNNNHKGSKYELYFAIKKICEYCQNQEDIEYVYFIPQTTAFVDDLCIEDRVNSVKKNFQAKNTEGSTAKWSESHASRFEMQKAIDLEYFNFNESFQYLVVPTFELAQSSVESIPMELKEYCFYEHFGHAESIYQLICSDKTLRSYIENLCNNADIASLDNAFSYLLAAWQSDDQRSRSVSEILGCARRMAKPDIFCDWIQENAHIPEWLYELCAIHHVELHVECQRFIFNYNNMSAGCHSQLLLKPPADELKIIKSDIGMFFELVLKAEANELSD